MSETPKKSNHSKITGNNNKVTQKIGVNQEHSLMNKTDMTKTQILELIDEDLHGAFEHLDKRFLSDPIYRDLLGEFISPSNNFSRAIFRQRLKRFISLKW